jgi:hypothetical protein
MSPTSYQAALPRDLYLHLRSADAGVKVDRQIGSLSGLIPASFIAGQKANISQTLTITDTALPAGSYFLLVDLDPDEVFNGVSVASNVFAAALAITGGE